MPDQTGPNVKPLLAQAALIKQIKYGKLDVSLELHNGEIKALSVFGNKKQVFNRTPSDEHDNNNALVTILQRIKESLEKGESSELSFTINVSKGLIRAVSWNSVTSLRY